MMKKLLLAFSAITLITLSVRAQDANFDKKFRFGLRITPQPTWFKSDDKNNIPNGAKFGFGFGLNMEFRLSDIVGLQTGIGGDFEGAKYKFRNEPGVYQAMYIMNENNEFVDPNGNTDGINNKAYKSNTAYVLKDRQVKTTWVTIPILLKLSTKEFLDALKIYGMFGGEIGIRVGAKATDSYYQTGKFVPHNSDTLLVFNPIPGIDSQSGLDVSKEMSGIPMRVCFNAGLGAEYRLSGSTAAFININYFMALSNQMRKESDYVFYKTEPSTAKSTMITQKLKMSGIRISLGIMF
jgi:hypothetical protein